MEILHESGFRDRGMNVPSIAWRFQPVTRFGWTWCSEAISCSGRSTRSAFIVTLAFSSPEQAFGETGAGAHVRAGLQKAPEVAGIALEGPRPKRPLPGGGGLIMAPRLDEGLRRLFRQRNFLV